MTSRATPERLEQVVDRMAREQPLRRAPSSLSRTVFAEIERRTAQPWWRRDFSRWPAAARVLFLVCACVPVALAYLGAGTLESELGAVSQRVESMPQLTLLHAMGTAMRLVTRVFASEWLYGGAVAITLLYAVLFGLSAAGYRALYARS